MAKIKKSGKKNNYLKASDTKKLKALEFFNRCTIFLLLVIIVSLILCFEKPYELEHASVHGPALWFLHLIAWPILFLPGVINNFSWANNTAVMKYLIDDNPALVLAILGSLLVGVIWGIIRKWGMAYFGINGMRSAGHFMLIIACWGVLQLAISAVIVLQDTNSLIPFHPVKKNTQAVQQQPAAGAENTAATGK